MAQPSPPQIPQHVSALLSHLTSRPGVQSTLILSRKDGSIIQSTGLLAANAGSATAGNANANASTPRTNSGSISTTENPASGVAATAGSPETIAQDNTNTNNNNATALAKSANPPYKPTQAEALAAHIHAFMTSASGLTLSLSGSTSASEVGHESRPSVNGAEDSTADDQDKDGERGDEDDEIKLLRLRTKKHEIVVVPDRKYLLCVVHDASGAAASAGASR